MWALFINIQRIHILHAVFANIRRKCNFRYGNVGSVHTYICSECFQILHAGFKQAVCLWKVLIFAYAMHFVLWKLVEYNLRKVNFLTLNRAFKKVCTLPKKPRDIGHLGFLIWAPNWQKGPYEWQSHRPVCANRRRVKIFSMCPISSTRSLY